MAFPYSEGSDYAESLLSAKLLFMESVFSWYAVYTAARAEKKVKERLDQIGIENYLPLRTEYRVWSDRKTGGGLRRQVSRFRIQIKDI